LWFLEQETGEASRRTVRANSHQQAFLLVYCGFWNKKQVKRVVAPSGPIATNKLFVGLLWFSEQETGEASRRTVRSNSHQQAFLLVCKLNNIFE
jgi:hypothetical protein